MSIQRYEFTDHHRGMDTYSSMDKTADGDYVRFADHEAALAALTKERDDVKAKHETLYDKMERLRAESFACETKAAEAREALNTARREYQESDEP